MMSLSPSINLVLSGPHHLSPFSCLSVSVLLFLLFSFPPTMILPILPGLLVYFSPASFFFLQPFLFPVPCSALWVSGCLFLHLVSFGMTESKLKQHFIALTQKNPKWIEVRWCCHLSTSSGYCSSTSETHLKQFLNFIVHRHIRWDYVLKILILFQVRSDILPRLPACVWEKDVASGAETMPGVQLFLINQQPWSEKCMISNLIMLS